MALNSATVRPRIVVFGGTFDPVHNGHIAIARCLRDELHAERVLMAPAGQPWLRDGPPIAAPKDRFRMVELAVAGERQIEASDVDIVRDGTTYSIDTIQDFRHSLGDGVDFVIAIGSDAAHSLKRWHRYGDLAKACTFVIVERPGLPLDQGSKLPPDTKLIRGPMMDISASEIRASYGKGDLFSTAKVVPDSTHRFIIEHGLYACDTLTP